VCCCTLSPPLSWQKGLAVSMGEDTLPPSYHRDDPAAANQEAGPSEAAPGYFEDPSSTNPARQAGLESYAHVVALATNSVPTGNSRPYAHGAVYAVQPVPGMATAPALPPGVTTVPFQQQSAPLPLNMVPGAQVGAVVALDRVVIMTKPKRPRRFCNGPIRPRTRNLILFAIVCTVVPVILAVTGVFSRSPSSKDVIEEDVDECTLGTHGCHAAGICTNSVGNYTCRCSSGYSGDGFSCSITPIQVAQVGARNHNPVRFQIHSSALNNEHTIGSEARAADRAKEEIRATRTLRDGVYNVWLRGDLGASNEYVDVYYRNSSFVSAPTAKIKGRLSSGQDSSVWIQVLSLENWNSYIHSSSLFLVVTPSSTVNLSPSGMPSGLYYQLRVEFVPDVDECSLGYHDCGSGHHCVNTLAGFQCQDDDECSQQSHNCHSNALCTNNVGSFTCACKPGYTGDGTTCSAVPAAPPAPPADVVHGRPDNQWYYFSISGGNLGSISWDVYVAGDFSSSNEYLDLYARSSASASSSRTSLFSPRTLSSGQDSNAWVKVGSSRQWGSYVVNGHLYFSVKPTSEVNYSPTGMNGDYWKIKLVPSAAVIPATTAAPTIPVPTPAPPVSGTYEYGRSNNQWYYFSISGGNLGSISWDVYVAGDFSSSNEYLDLYARSSASTSSSRTSLFSSGALSSGKDSNAWVKVGSSRQWGSYVVNGHLYFSVKPTSEVNFSPTGMNGDYWKLRLVVV